MKLKFTLQRLFRFTGFELIRLETARRQTLAPQLAQIFEKFDISCVLDVGANTGGYGDYLREKVGYRKLILSFEPVSAMYEVLARKSKKDPNWEVFNFGLGPSNSTMEINVMKHNAFSSFLAPDDFEEPSYMANNVVVYTESVQVRTLDSVMEGLAEKCPTGRTYLKMDTQGYDMEVVRGAEKSLEKIIALQTEASTKKMYKGMPDFVETYQTLASKGFDITGMFPLAWDSSLRVIELDCIFVNSALLDKPASPRA